MQNEAERARIKLDQLCDELRGRIDMGSEAWDLIDGVYEGVDALEKKAYLVIRIPAWLTSRESRRVR